MLPGFEYFPKGEQEGKTVINGHKISVKGGKGFEILIPVINEKSGLMEYVSLGLKFAIEAVGLLSPVKKASRNSSKVSACLF